MNTDRPVRAWYSADLRKHEQLMSLLETYHKVRLGEGVDSKYGDMLTWGLEHCQGKFRDIRHSDGLDWYFELEADATLFALKWT
jgi:hypothetical protein